MARRYYINPFTGNLDGGDDSTYLDTIYLRLDTSNDPLTGELVITPSSGDNALKANKNITLKEGQRLIFDGA